jgi:co-chaperonin GroES (HSP10)
MQLTDYHVISVERIYDDRLSETGLIKLNTAWYRVEKELDRYERKCLEGKIVSVPAFYSNKNHMPIDPGIPNPRIYVGHDAIQIKANQGYDWGNEKYYPGMNDKIDFETIADYGAKIDAKVGDRVFFHPSVTEPENFLKEENGVMFYKASVEELICVVSDTIRPQGGYVLVEPVMETENEIKSDTGLILKGDVEAKLLQGVIKYCREGSGLSQGMDILYQVYANWELTIDGIKYYAMKEDEIWATKIG